ncbi:hypothetical protein LPB137_07960 [Poseidonibacter parvus]|uniref:TonB-dependent receptor n=1 Tax=Poseidonibacter parvus TaxID=1850254 RepID=A0A1P8KML0_9BACT|nr:TonB-dependent receptor [Poseidonibacter parvus]APW65791.1 hypothetical protein LPB137_07960 [Poseidonibacter parvus]
MNKKISTSLGLSLLIATNIYANDTAQLDEITVTSATKSSQSIKDVTSNIDVITKEELEERNFTTVSEALNTLAGISYTSNGGLGKATSIRVRGFDSDRVLLLLDGVRLNDLTGTSGAQIQHLQISDIKQIEVIKGAQSGIWGADATSGVINIISNPIKSGLHGNINLEAGSFNTKKISTNISYKNEKISTKISHSFLDTDGFTAQAPRGTDVNSYEKDGYINRTTSAKVDYKLNDSNKIALSHTFINADNEADSYNNPNGSSDSEFKNRITSVNLENISSNFTTDISFKRSDFKRNYPTGYTKSFNGDINEYGIKSNLKYNTDSFLLFGFDYKDFEHKDDINEKYNNKGIFLTNSNKFNNLVVTESLRYDKYTAFDNKLTGKLGLKYSFNQSIYLSANAGTAYNVPTPYERFGPYSNSSYDLQPDTTKSADVTFGFNGLKLTYFHNKIKNMKTFDKSTFEYANLDGTSTIKGFEIEYKKEILLDLLTTLNYTKNYAKDNEKYKLERVPTETFKVSFDYYGIDKLHIGINSEYVGDRVEYSYGTHTVDARTGNYTVWNSVINYEINKTFSTYLKVDNLFNKYYQTVDGYATAERSAYVGLKATF